MDTRLDGYGIGVTALAVLWLAGCATAVPVDPEQESAPEPPYRYGVSWGPAGRGGAVERGSDYIHVLHRGRSYFVPTASVLKGRTTSRAEPTFTATPDQRASIATLIENIVSAIEAAPRADSPVVSSGDDELRSAWKRYCRGGEGLTEGDWELLKEAGAPENIPPDLAAACVPPK